MPRSNITLGGQELKLDADADTSIQASTDDVLVVDTAGTERLRILADGDFLYNTTSVAVGSADSATSAVRFDRDGIILQVASNNTATTILNRTASKGTLIDLRQAGSTFAKIGIDSGNDLQIHSTASSHTGLQFGNGNITPLDNTGADLDNVVDLGAGSVRFDDIHATNGTIQTSDENEKQNIASATAKELNVAKKLSALFKTFRWKDRVTEKGDKARTHTGIIAQEVQSAFSAEGLDASNYGLFTSYTWTNDDDKEQTRLGVRYPELFSFIFSSIEARLTALESK